MPTSIGVRVLLAAAGTGLFLCASKGASAQAAFPNRTVKIVVPVPPGPLLDVLPRILAEKLDSKWGVPVIVENRPGAASNIGAETVAKAEPDGYTMLVTPPGPLVVSKWLFPNLAFDPGAFAPVTVLITQPPVIVVSPKVPVANLRDLIAFAKANPSKLNYGSPGTGSTPQLAMERLQQTAGIKFGHVPYQGMGPAMNDLLAGHIDVMMDSLGNVRDHARDGRLKLLAVTTGQRRPEIPEVPAVSEILPGFVHTEWFAVVGPPKLPGEIAEKLSADIAGALRLPDIARRLQELNVDLVASPPAEAREFIRQEAGRWQAALGAGKATAK